MSPLEELFQGLGLEFQEPTQKSTRKYKPRKPKQACRDFVEKTFINHHEAKRILSKEYDAAKSMTELGKPYGVSATTILLALKKLNIPRKTRGGRSKKKGIYGLKYEVNGVSGTLRFLSDHYGINYNTVWTRMKRGWSLEKAVSTPTRTYKQED